MDCLSYFSNSDCFIPDLDMIIPETDTFFLPAQPQHHGDQALSPSLFGLNPFCLPPQEIFPSNPKTEAFVDLDSLFPTLTHNNSLFIPSPNPNPFDSYAASNISEFLVPDFSPAFKVGWSGGQDDRNKERVLSPQSIAARKRRRRITEKTQELGKLIPGSHKHNTAEMFQAAAKYVKFLQSQIEILQLISQTKMQTPESSTAEREMQFLLASQEIQEKLSTEEVCVVPRDIVNALKAQGCILRNLKISREDVNKLLS